MIKLWNYLPEDYVWSKFHQNEPNICKNLNPLEVVVYDEYYVTISVVVMAFCLMVFYKNLKPSWNGASDRFVQPIAEQLKVH